LAALAAFAACAAAAPPEDPLLARIRQRVENALQHIPDYTCLETIERVESNRLRSRTRREDVVRLEVAHVGGRELFALPGESGFSDKLPVELIENQGLTSTGEFSGHLAVVFGNLKTVFFAAGTEELDGRLSLRYDYYLPKPPGCWWLALAERSGSTGCRGAFWVNADSLDLLRFEIHATQIPSSVPIKEASVRIAYGSVRIGSAEALLPLSAVSALTELDGYWRRNTTEFSHCRQYAGTSAISFGEPAPGDRATAPASSGLRAPAGLRLRVQLDRGIDLTTSAAGELFTARVAQDAVDQGAVAVPKGALLQGRVRRLERGVSVDRRILVVLEFFALESAGHRVQFYGTLESVGSLPGLRRPRSQEPEVPGVATLSLASGHGTLPRGLAMVWRVIDPRR
jgi:hypothetical protein